MFRLQDNVPEVYVEESRDFQLFCRLFDIVFSGVKFSIDSMLRVVDTQHCDARILELLKTKLGIFKNIHLSERELRYLLQGFPDIIKYKGSKHGVQLVLNLFQRINKNVNFIAEFDISNNHEIVITFGEYFNQDELLYLLLDYVIPTGYFVTYNIARRNVQTDTLSIDTDQTMISLVKDRSESYVYDERNNKSDRLSRMPFVGVVNTAYEKENENKDETGGNKNAQ